jgi:hypothetical protein
METAGKSRREQANDQFAGCSVRSLGWRRLDFTAKAVKMDAEVTAE